MEDSQLLLTVDEAARRLSIGRSQTYVLLMKGELESVKVGRCRRVVASAVSEYVERLKADQMN